MRMLLLTLIFLLTACAAHKSADSESSAQREVSDAAARWVAAYNSRDAARISSMYEPDAVLWGTTATTISPTPAAISDYFKDAGKRPKARVEIVEQHIRVLGDVAFSTGRYIFTNFDGEKTVQSPSRFSFVFQKRNKEWRIVHHHSSRAISR